MSEISEVMLREAIDRIARTSDGELLYLYCQRILCRVVPDGTPDGALPRNEGRRSFAAELIALMGNGIAESGRSSPIVTFAVAGPRSGPRARGAGRRVGPGDSVPGWDAPDARSGPGATD